MIPRPVDFIRCDTCKKMMFLRPTRGAQRLHEQGKPYWVQCVGEYMPDGSLRKVRITKGFDTPIRCARCEAKAQQPALYR